MSRMRVLVCGSNYGRTYINALAREPHKFQLAGILAQGSVRSQRLAALNSVPLYRSADELPDTINLACAAMSSDAAPVVLQLIRRGIHVLCEHPYPSDWLKRAFYLAQERGVQFHVNGHFANLPAPEKFIRECRQAGERVRPEFLEVMATERSLYGALDILLAAAGSRQPLRVHVLSRQTKFVLLEGNLGRVAVRLSVQASQKGRGRLIDGSPDYLVDQRLTAAFPAGLLTLSSMAGPVLWNRTPSQAEDEEPLWSVVCSRATRTLAELGEHRTRANVAALNAIRQSILGLGTPGTQHPQHILRVSKTWELIGRHLY